MSDEHSRKIFSLSTDILLAIVLVLSIMAAFFIGTLSLKVSVLKEKVSYLEDHDIELLDFKNELFKEFIKNKYKEE